MKSATFALLALIAGAAPALAQSRADRAACTPDVMRLCASQIPNVAAITVLPAPAAAKSQRRLPHGDGSVGSSGADRLERAVRSAVTSR